MLERRGTVLAFDFGTTKIGVAVGDWESRMAHPLEVIRGEANDPRFARIAALIEEWRPTQLVAGLPLSLDGEEHDLTRRARRFAHQLNGRFRLPVTLVDERLTSVEADARLRETGLKAAGRKQVEDSVAAQQILQDLFDHVFSDHATAPS
jgi:putative Holliday junction resolvase